MLFPFCARLKLAVCLRIFLFCLSLAPVSLAQGRVTLGWDANPESDIAGYRVHYGTAPGELPLREVTDILPTATLRGLEPGTTYFCAVQAFNSAGLAGPLSAEISFTLPGESRAEISVETPSEGVLADHQGSVDFGGIVPGSAPAVVSFTLRNLGTTTLSGLALTSDSAEFTPQALGVSSLAPGGSTLFTVAFRPSAVGLRRGALQIASNDVDESPFDVALSGSGLATPEIAIFQNSGSELSDGAHSIPLGSTLIGATGPALTFTIENTGTANLTDLALTLRGGSSADFVLAPPAQATLGPGGLATFQVALRPSAVGSRSATLQVASNDADENPFDITLTGSGLGVPDIAIGQIGGGSLVGSQPAVNLGSVHLGASGAAPGFTLANLGSAALSGISLTLEGAHAADFLLSSNVPGLLAPAGSGAFNVTFKPTAVGNRSASLRIVSNDPDENPITLVLSGLGVAVPEIAIRRTDSVDLTDGTAVLNFGNVNLVAAPRPAEPGTLFLVAGGGATETITLLNLGTAPLSGLAISIDGAHAANFTAGPLATTSLAPGTSTQIPISFRPSAAGIRTAALHVSSNDANENPFDITLTGAGVAVPVLSLETTAGAPFDPATAAIAFDPVDVGGTGITETVVLRNTGTGVLTGIQVTASGAHGADFVLAAPPVTTLAPGASTRFSVSFKPTGAGSRTAVIRASSDLATLAPFEIDLRGVGIARPEMAVFEENGSPMTSGVGAVTFSRFKVGTASATRTFTVRNLGSAALTGLSVTRQGPHAADFRVVTPPVEKLAPGASTTFQVSFKPTTPGSRTAELTLSRDDADEGPFILLLGGTGVPAPEIDILQGSKAMQDGTARVHFGSAIPRSQGRTQIFTIRNSGTARLDRISLKPTGTHVADFKIGRLQVKSLAPGASARFRVTFKPNAQGLRRAGIQIASNDGDEKSFDIVLVGQGKVAAAKHQEAFAKKFSIGPVVGTEVHDGLKYRTLTIARSGGKPVLANDVEVSSNRIDWFSGHDHTTVLVDTARSLKVRDNTPVRLHRKRFIRIRQKTANH